MLLRLKGYLMYKDTEKCRGRDKRETDRSRQRTTADSDGFGGPTETKGNEKYDIISIFKIQRQN